MLSICPCPHPLRCPDQLSGRLLSIKGKALAWRVALAPMGTHGHPWGPIKNPRIHIFLGKSKGNTDVKFDVPFFRDDLDMLDMSPYHGSSLRRQWVVILSMMLQDPWRPIGTSWRISCGKLPYRVGTYHVEHPTLPVIHDLSIFINNHTSYVFNIYIYSTVTTLLRISADPSLRQGIHGFLWASKLAVCQPLNAHNALNA